MGIVRGYAASLEYQTDGVAGSAGWEVLGIVQDVEVNLDATEIDVTTRASAGWKQYEPGLRDAQITFSMLFDKADEGYEAIRDAWESRSVIGLRALDAATSGEGLVADFKITSFSNPQPLDGVLVVNCTARLCQSATAPSWQNA